MMRTLRSGQGELSSAPEGVNGHDFEAGEALGSSRRRAAGTPWPPAQAPSEVHVFAAPDAIGNEPEEDEWEADTDEPEVPEWAIEADELERSDWAIDFMRTARDLRGALDLDASVSLPLIEVVGDVGTRTLMGVGARAVRAVAKSGCVEARLARRGPHATPDASPPQALQPGVDSSASPRVIVSPLGAAEESSRRAIARSSREGQAAPSVQPPRWPGQALQQEPAAGAGAISARRARLAGALAAWGIAPAPDFAVRTHAIRRRASVRPAHRVLGISLLAITLGVLAAYVTAVL